MFLIDTGKKWNRSEKDSIGVIGEDFMKKWHLKIVLKWWVRFK